MLQNVPNIITLFRIIISPLLWFMIIQSKHYQVIFIIWCFCALSDILDGFIARMYKLETNTGAYLDPIADKILINGIFISFIYTGVIVNINIIAVCIMLLRDIIRTYYKIDAQASILGKYKTTLQNITICMMILNIQYSNIVLWLATLCSIYSLLQYLRRF